MQTFSLALTLALNLANPNLLIRKTLVSGPKLTPNFFKPFLMNFLFAKPDIFFCFRNWIISNPIPDNFLKVIPILFVLSIFVIVMGMGMYNIRNGNGKGE